MCPWLIDFGKDAGRVVAAEAKGVAKHMLQLDAGEGLGDGGEIMAVDFLGEVEVGGHEVAGEGENGDNALDAAGCTRGVAGVGFGGGDKGHFVAEDTHHGLAFALVVVGSASAVGIDVVDVAGLEAGALQGLRHGEEGTFAFRRRGGLVVGIALVGVARQFADGLHAPLGGVLAGFHHHVCRALAEVESVPVLVEGLAGLRVKDHQRVEAVEMELAETFGAAGNHKVGAATAQQVGAEDDGVGRRRAGRGDGGLHGDAPRILLSNHVGTGAAVVQGDVLVAEVVGEEVLIELLTFLHAADGSAGEEGDTLVVVPLQAGHLHGFPQGHPSQQGGAGDGKARRNAQHLPQVVVAERHLGDRNLRVHRVQITHPAHPRLRAHQPVGRRLDAAAKGRDDPHACDDNVTHCQPIISFCVL